MDEVTLTSLDRAERIADLFNLADRSLDPIFWEADRAGTVSAWWQHVPFGYWIVSKTKPHLVVELGTHTGVSYSAFCQTVANLELDTRCYAIDTWRGDLHAGLYGEEVFEEFRSFHDERYGAFSTLLRTSFDEALAQFADGTIDLLHIDGLHTYDAVRHDFENWKPKLSRHAVVLLHDTNERKDDFGVWRLWGELCEQYPHFEFLHGHGLGVLAVGSDVNPAIIALCQLSDPTSITKIRGRFVKLGDRCLNHTREKTLAQALGVLSVGEHAEVAQQRLEANATELNETKRHLELANQACRDAELRVRQEQQARYEALASARESAQERERALHRTMASRLELYDASFHKEQAEERAQAAEMRAREAETAVIRALTERDAMLSSTVWQMTWPLRVIASSLSPKLT
jgi:hypothetical protein